MIDLVTLNNMINEAVVLYHVHERRLATHNRTYNDVLGLESQEDVDTFLRVRDTLEDEYNNFYEYLLDLQHLKADYHAQGGL